MEEKESRHPVVCPSNRLLIRFDGLTKEFAGEIVESFPKDVRRLPDHVCLVDWHSPIVALLTANAAQWKLQGWPPATIGGRYMTVDRWLIDRMLVAASETMNGGASPPVVDVAAIERALYARAASVPTGRRIVVNAPTGGMLARYWNDPPIMAVPPEDFSFVPKEHVCMKCIAYNADLLKLNKRLRKMLSQKIHDKWNMVANDVIMAVYDLLERTPDDQIFVFARRPLDEILRYRGKKLPEWKHKKGRRC